MKTRRWIMLLAICLACASCAKQKVADPKLWDIQTPVAKVISLTVTQQTDDGFRVEAVVELENTNRVPLPMEKVNYQIAIAKVGAISVTDHASRTIPAMGKQQIVLPASFAWKGSAPAGASWKLAGSIQYLPPGELRQILTETYVPLPDTAFSSSGTLK